MVLNFKHMFIKCFIYIFAFMVLPILVLYFFATSYNTNILVEQKRISVLQEINTVDFAISELLDKVESTASQFCSNDTLVNYFSDDSYSVDYLNSIKAEFLNNYYDISHISLMDSEYHFIDEDEVYTNDLYWFYKINKPKGGQFSNGYWSPTLALRYVSSIKDNPRVISYVKPISDNTGILGYVVFFVPTQNFKPFIDNIDDDSMLLENDNFFVSKKDIPYSKNFYAYYKVNTSVFLSDKSVIVNSGDDTQIVTVKEFSPLNLQFVVLSSYKDFRNEISVPIPNIATVSLFAILFALFVSLILSHQITKPIIQLKNTMEEVGHGDFSIRSNITGNDEVANLSRHFNSLLDKIQELIESLKKKHEEHELIQFQLIQEQVKPHFLYNMLETINSMIRCGLYQQSIQVVSNLALFYRISLSNGNTVVPISSEYQLIKSYLELQQVRYIEFMNFTLAVSSSIMQYKIPKLTLQPLIENAIYHGIKEKGTMCTLCVSGYLEDGNVVFEVFDNGIGIPKEKLNDLIHSIDNIDDPSSNFGLTSVMRRLNLLSANKATMIIDSVQNKYTCVQIRLPAIL